MSVDLSTHADQSELLDWLRTGNSPHMVYVNHGENAASDALAAAIEQHLRMPAVVAQPLEKVRLRRPAGVAQAGVSAPTVRARRAGHL